MASLLQRLNQVAGAGEEFKTIKKLSELKVNIPHAVREYRRVTTRYGISIVADLEDENVSVFLPKRFASELTDDDLKQMSRDGIKIISKGVTKGSKFIALKFVVK